MAGKHRPTPSTEPTAPPSWPPPTWTHGRTPWFWRGLARALSVCFGAFTVLSAVAALRDPGFDANLWWVDLRVLPARVSAVILLVAGGLLLAEGILPTRRGWRLIALRVALVCLLVAAVANTVSFYRSWSDGRLDPHILVPMSVLVFVVLAFLLRMTWREIARSTTRELVMIAAVGLAFLLLLPLAQIVWFGSSNYARPADAIVVFGAKVHEGGVPSLSLQDLGTLPGGGRAHECANMRVSPKLV